VLVSPGNMVSDQL